MTDQPHTDAQDSSKDKASTQRQTAEHGEAHPMGGSRIADDVAGTIKEITTGPKPSAAPTTTQGKPPLRQRLAAPIWAAGHWTNAASPSIAGIATVLLAFVAAIQLLDLRKANESGSKAADAASSAAQLAADANGRAAAANEKMAAATERIAVIDKQAAEEHRKAADALDRSAESLKKANEMAAEISVFASQLAATQENYRKQAEQMSEIERRPYLGITATLEPSKITNQLIVKIQIHNSGLTPAYDLSSIEKVDCLPLFDDGSSLTVPLPVFVGKPIIGEVVAPQPGATIQPGNALLRTFIAPMTNWTAWDAGTVKGWVYGRVIYLDIFGKQHRANFRLYRGTDLQTGQPAFFQGDGGNDCD